MPYINAQACPFSATPAWAKRRLDAPCVGTLPAVETVKYAPGRLADVYGGPARPTVLLWHGVQTDARAAVGPLAGLLAARGATVVAPDWKSHAHDGGRGTCCDRLPSPANAPAGTAAWSSSGGRWGRRRLPVHVAARPARRPTASREFAARLHESGWPVDLFELSADHGSIAGAEHQRRSSARPGGSAAKPPARQEVPDSGHRRRAECLRPLSRTSWSPRRWDCWRHTPGTARRAPLRYSSTRLISP